ncbi:MAG: hypothetical protein JXQ80_07660 [Bacteroidales bacterium]|nr:hypothetical protein [Bacteroidales bacterium]
MENNVLKHEASLKIIYDMIESAKSRIGRNYFYYLFWGYLVAFTCIAEFLLIKVVQYPQHYLVWPILMTLGTLVTLWFYLRQKRAEGARTFIGTAMAYLWLGWMISLGILIFFANMRQAYGVILPTAMAMYGLAIFVSGGLVNYKPLIWGALLAWISGIIAFLVPYPVQLLIFTGAVALSYIVPGHLLKIKSKTM